MFDSFDQSAANVDHFHCSNSNAIFLNPKCPTPFSDHKHIKQDVQQNLHILLPCLPHLHHSQHCCSCCFIMPHRSELRQNLPMGHLPLPRPERHTLLPDPPQPLRHRPGPTPQANLHVPAPQLHRLRCLPL